MKEEFKKLIYEGLRKAKASNIDIYTIALYHDQESHVATVCIDTIESSRRAVISSNAYWKKYFLKAIQEGDIESAMRRKANGGRSFELGSFALINASEIDVPYRALSPDFYLDMVYALEEMRGLIELQSSHGPNLIFCCSAENLDVGLVWS